jgi:hypothetical protein
MAIWEQGTPVTALDLDNDITGVAFGDRINIDGVGPVYVKVFAQKYRRNDGTDYCNIGHGVQAIVPADYFEEE